MGEDCNKNHYCSPLYALLNMESEEDIKSTDLSTEEVLNALTYIWGPFLV